MRFYRALLWLYPLSFRAEYGAELCATFAERTQGRSGLLVALLALGDVVPNALGEHWHRLCQDVAYAARSLRRTPGFTLTAVAVVALGVGANTAVFSLADAIFVRPLPYAGADGLVKLFQRAPGYPQMELSPANYRDWKGMTSSFSAMGAYTIGSANMVSGSEPRRIETVAAEPELWSLLGVAPLLGRVFRADELERGRFIVLGHQLWQSELGGDRDVVGKAVRLDGVSHTILGVMPPSFQFPARTIEAWTPLVLRPGDYQERNDNYLEALARLRPGVSAEQARQELAVISARLEQTYPRDNKEVGATVVGLRSHLPERARLLVLALCGAALCILLLACANLASLFLARGAHRTRELAVRAALGAGPERLRRQLITESLTISVMGGLAGVMAAAFALPLLSLLVPANLPLPEPLSLDLRVLTLALGFVLLSGLTFGMAPAWRAGQARALDALRSGTRTAGGTQRIRAALVVAEIAASVVLLITSGLLIRAVWRIQATDPGFVADSVLTLRTDMRPRTYGDLAPRVLYYRRVLDEARALPGVQRAAFTTGVPMSMRGRIWPVAIQGEQVVRSDRNSVSLRYVTPDYFSSMGIPLRAGRDVAESDTRDGLMVAVVSESFAHRHWPGQNPLGKRFNVAFSERTVVGVVGHVQVRGLERPSEPQVYLPYRQVPDGALLGYMPRDLVLRLAPGLDGGALLPRLRAIVRSADAELPISHVRTMEDIVADDTASRVTQLRLLGAFSLIALIIAGLGIHGLLSFAVTRRSQELGVRRALGAQAGGIVGLVLREGLALAAVGIAIGVPVAYAAARGMGALLSGVRPEDPLTIAAAAGLCLTTAVVGCLRPALRAARVDPMTALRAE
jgi:predicted permease